MAICRRKVTHARETGGFAFEQPPRSGTVITRATAKDTKIEAQALSTTTRSGHTNPSGRPARFTDRPTERPRCRQYFDGAPERLYPPPPSIPPIPLAACDPLPGPVWTASASVSWLGWEGRGGNVSLAHGGKAQTQAQRQQGRKTCSDWYEGHLGGQR
ncbi:hypothetical protein BN1723_015271 [Verticillium longisporum]|uniref:Uncharacterized protein n=1 Tax=Verticillium longisporum TaxID=100787 RepID=A0A0G4MUT6_VERLO|nr:hypothetical protein BN1723_015271 [Verticillium longisporum]